MQRIVITEEMRDSDFGFEFGIGFENEMSFKNSIVSRVHQIKRQALLNKNTFKDGTEIDFENKFDALFSVSPEYKVGRYLIMFQRDYILGKTKFGEEYCACTLFRNGHIAKASTIVINGITQRHYIIECDAVYGRWQGIPYKRDPKHSYIGHPKI